MKYFLIAFMYACIAVSYIIYKRIDEQGSFKNKKQSLKTEFVKININGLYHRQKNLIDEYLSREGVVGEVFRVVGTADYEDVISGLGENNYIYDISKHSKDGRALTPEGIELLLHYGDFQNDEMLCKEIYKYNFSHINIALQINKSQSICVMGNKLHIGKINDDDFAEVSGLISAGRIEKIIPLIRGGRNITYDEGYNFIKKESRYIVELIIILKSESMR